MKDSRLGTTLDRYFIEGIIGEGGMATVYRVRHTDLGTLHALKLLKHHSKAIADRMLQEGRIQARLRHPNIVAVTDVVRSGNDVGLVMDYVDGLPLGLITYNLQMNPAQLDELALGLFAGVEAAHNLGLVHRDLKLDNIMMAFSPGHLEARVMDFGLAKAVRDELRVGRSTRAGSMMGTPAFMAPEQYRDSSAVDHRADIYSIGAILYEAVAGEPVFPDEDLPVLLAKCQTGDWKPLDEVIPDARPSWVRAIHACLAVDPEARPQSMAALRELWEAEPIPPVTWDASQVAHLRKLQEVPETAPPASSRREGPSGAGRPSPTVAASAPTTLEPSDTAAVADDGELDGEEEEASSRGVWLAVAAAIAMVGIGGVVGVGLLAAAFGLMGPPSTQADGADPSDVAALPAPEPEPEPVAEPQPAAVPPAAPAAPPPAPVRPAPGPKPAAPTPDPQPAPAPQPAPSPAPVGGAAVVLPGYDGYLMQGTKRFGLTGVPAGTYDLYVFFDGQVPSLAGKVTLATDQSASMRCDKRSKICR